MLVRCQLEIETVDLAPPRPNVDQARHWLREVREVLENATAGSATA